MATVAALVVAGCGGSSSPKPTPLPPQHPHRAGPESIFTSPSTSALTPATLDELKRLGVDRIHIYMHWSDIAPAPTIRRKPSFDAADPSAYPSAGWAAYDTVIRDAQTRGFGVDIAIIPPPPAWASGRGAPNPATQPQWRPSASDFGRFVHAVGTRYSGSYSAPGSAKPLPRVDFWSIWNEPNLGNQLAPEVKPHTQIESAPAQYRALLDAAWNALGQTGHGHDTILFGELAPAGESTGVGNFNNMPALRFLRALYCVGSDYRPLSGAAARERACPSTAAGSRSFATAHPALFHASGVADHPYPFGTAPDEATPNEPDYATLAVIGKLQSTLDRLNRVYGSSARFPIWSTEFGFQTTPPDNGTATISPARAADYLNWSEYLTWLDPRLRSYDQYQMTDGPAGIFASGLRFANGTPKPGYAAFRMPLYLPVTHGTAKQPLLVWGCVRPAPDAARATRRRQQVGIQFKPASGRAFTTVQTVALTGPHGYFEIRHTFGGSGEVRLAWRPPHGPHVVSRTVTISLH
jgi:hypothetical protein